MIYKVIHDMDLESFEAKVSASLNEGWQLVGGLIRARPSAINGWVDKRTDVGWYMQSMIRAELI